MPKFNEIGPNESAKMVVRAMLFMAPDNIRNKYKKFIAPITLTDITVPDEIEIPESNNKLLEDLVNAFRRIPAISLENPLLSEEAIKSLVQEQRSKVIDIAKPYVEKKGFEHYSHLLETILQNVASRKIVTYNHPNEQEIHTRNNNNEGLSLTAYPDTFFKSYQINEKVKADINSILNSNSGKAEKLEDVMIDLK